MTNEINQALTRLPARSVRALLEEIYELRRQGLAERPENLDKVPLITLHLRSGKEFSGWLLSLGSAEDAKAKNSVLLHRHDLNTRTLNDSDVLYLDLDQIEAVTVHKAHRAAVRLADEWKGAPPADVPTPSRVDAKRKAEELAAFVSKIGGFPITYEVNWDELPKTDGATFWLVEALVETTGVLSTMLNLPELKTEFSKNLKTVRFVNAPQPAVSRDEATLVISVALNAGRDGLTPQSRLRSAIDEAF